MSIFISYSRADSEFVDLLQRLLVSKGYSTWIDRRNIGAGSRWDQAIEQAIQAQSHLIVVLTPESAASENVADEWSYAIEEGKTIIPIFYRACSVPMRLRRLQGIDFEKQVFADAFRALTATLGEPDNRPSDPVQLAKREGIILVEVDFPMDMERTRVGFVYSDYPVVQSFLNIVYMTLLRGRIQAHSYGKAWVLRDKLTHQEYAPKTEKPADQLLLNEIGVEPGAQLEIVFRKE